MPAVRHFFPFLFLFFVLIHTVCFFYSQTITLCLGPADAATLFALNEAVRAGDADGTLKVLSSTDLRAKNVRPECGTRYQTALTVGEWAL